MSTNNEIQQYADNATKSYISSKQEIGRNAQEQTFILANQKNISVGFDEVYKIYRFKLEKLRKYTPIKKAIEKFWNLLPHDFEGNMERDNFILLFKKIYRLILPYFNYNEIQEFLEGEWNLINKGNLNSINSSIFEKYFFNLIHNWTVHINKTEYLSFIEMIYSRIVKFQKTFANGDIQEICPNIKVTFYKIKSKKLYDEEAWEECKEEELEDFNNYEYYETDEEERKKFKRPALPDNFGYLNEDYLLSYNEEVYYNDNEALTATLKPMEIMEPLLMRDEEIVVFGYPAQYIIMHFKNKMGLYVSMMNEGNFDKPFKFKLQDFPNLEKLDCIMEFNDQDIVRTLSEIMLENKSILLSRDIFELTTEEFGEDFIQDEMNLFNNTKINYQFDRIMTFQEIKIFDKKKLYVNINQVYLNPSYKKALENVIKDEKVGLTSNLWTEKLYKKFKGIIKTKFALIYCKLLHLIKNIGIFSSVVEVILEEIKNEKENRASDTTIQDEFFRNFESKDKIIKDKFDSDLDIFDEANKKSPIILVMGAPLMGKTSICKKLAEEMNMVFLNPLTFFDQIFAKVAKFWEDLEASGEADEPAPEDGEEVDPNAPKKVKKGPDSVLTKLEFDIYNELNSGKEISEENLKGMYKAIIHSDLAKSRGIIIEHNSTIFPPEEKSFSENLFDGEYGDVKVDYIINLTMPENEINLRRNSIKFNLKTTNIISRRDIELIIKPKKPKKVVFEDEINEDDEEPPADEPNPDDEPVELSDEEKEKIPKETDLIAIQDFDNIYKNQLDYYNDVQIPIYKNYIKTLKKNYYVQIDISGFDFDDAADIIKNHLEITLYDRPIAKLLEEADYKDLLMANREGILPFRRWSLWKMFDPVSLKDDFVILNGKTAFPAEFMGRVFLFISEENRKKFLDNPKKYLMDPPDVPKNYRVAIFGPPKSGKNSIAKIINQLFGWKRINLEEIQDSVKDYQKSLDEPEPNNVYSNKIHYAAPEWRELITTNKKEKKPETFYSKVIFMLDYLGIPLDKKKTYDDFKEELKTNEEKLNHLLDPPKKKRRRKIIETPENFEQTENPEAENTLDEKNKTEDENKNEENEQNEGEEKEENEEDKEKDKYEEDVEENEYNEEDDEANSEFWEDEPYEDPFPPEEDYHIDDLRTEEMYYRFNLDGTYPRPGGFILMSHPVNEDEVNKFNEFNIVVDKIIHLVDKGEEPLRLLTARRNANFEKLDEDKQNAEIEKVKVDVTKVEEIVNLIKEKYIRNEEDPVLEVNCVDTFENIQKFLIKELNPFTIRMDNEERITANADVNPEEKLPLNKGEYGIFCPVTYKEENWLFYCGEEFETQLNQRKYRFASEKEMETFKKEPSLYINVKENFQDLENRLAPVKIPPPHIFFSGAQGSGISTLMNRFVKEFRLRKRELKREFMDIWDDQRLKRKSVRVEKKREELEKQKEEQEAEKKQKEPAEGEEEQAGEEMNIDELLANDAQLDEEEEGFDPVVNDKNIFKNLFDPFKASAYDASWFEINEKITTQFMDFMVESRKHPNVFVFIRVTLQTILERHLNEKQIKEYFSKLEEISKNKKLEAVEKLKKEKREEKYNELKEQFENEEGNQEMEIPENNEEIEGEEDPENPVGIPKKRELPDINTIEVELSEEELNGIMNEPDPDLPEYQSLVDAEKDRLVKRYEENNTFLTDFIEQLKAKLIPVIEINNDNNIENVYKNLLYQIHPYLKNRENIIEKQLVHINFPEMTMRKTKDLYNSQIYRLGAYKDFSPLNPDKLIKAVDYPLVYRDRLYFFNTLEERNLFAEEPLKYRTGKEFPLDVAKSCLNNIIYVVGNLQTGKSSISKILEEKGFKRLTLRRAIMDLLEENNLRDCILKKEITDILTKGDSIDDQMAIKILKKRLELSDCINKSIVIDGFPFTMSQTNSIIDENNSILNPSFIFVCEVPEKIILERAKKQKAFKSLIPVIHERFRNTKMNIKGIIKLLQNKDVDLRYLDTTKSFWYLKDLITNLLETKRKNSLKFAADFNYGKACNFNSIATIKLLKFVMERNKKHILKYFSPVAMKINNEFNYNKFMNNQFINYITYYKGVYNFLKNEEEFNFFAKNPEIFYKNMEEIKLDRLPVKFLKPFDLAKRICNKRIFEYQSCCPVSYREEKHLKDGKIIYSLEYLGKLFECESADKLIKFSIRPENYNKIKIKVKTIDDDIVYTENQVNFENTVNYLETNFGSFITKGMLELSKNRIKYPFLTVKQTSVKYLALFLKANNPNNNEYAKKKYSKKLDEFLKNAMLPYELLNVYENYNSISDENKLKKDLVRNQLNNLAVKYDELMEKAKIQTNAKFEGYFKN